MVIRYRFVTGDEYVEVPDEWASTLAELDKQGQNNQRKETRRHVQIASGLSESTGAWFFDKMAEMAYENVEDHIVIQKLLESLTPQQRTLLIALALEGASLTDIAKRQGISKPSVHTKIERLRKRIMKFYEGG